MLQRIKKIMQGDKKEPSVDQELQQKLDQINNKLDQKDHVAAGKLCLDLLGEYENCADLFRLYAATLKDEPGKAEEALLKSTKLEPGNGKNWDALGLFLLNQDRAEEADKAFAKAIRCDAKNPLFHHHRGLALAELGWFLRAGRAQQQAIRLDMSFADAHFALGMAYMAENQLKPAITAFKFAVKSDPAFIQAWRNLGLAQHLYKEPEEAVKTLQTACRANPENLEMIKYTAWMHREINQAQKAVELLQKQIENNHLGAADDAMTWLDLAESLMLVGDHHAALKACEKGIELDPDEPLGINMKGSILMNLQQADQAEDIFREALKKQPKNDYLLGQLGLALDVSGRQAEAQLVYQQALAIKPDNIDILTQSITFRKATEDDEILIDKLNKLLEKLIRKSDKNKQIKLRFALGKLYDDTQRYAKAFEHYFAGNNLKFNRLNYDDDAIKQYVDSLINYFHPEKLTASPWPSWQGNKSEQPVFIVGMPRSGTSLVEQIIASHPEASGAGELTTLPRLLEATGQELATKPNYPELLEMADADQMQALTEKYLHELQYRQTSSLLRITDKLPYNFFHIGLIDWIFPKAKIIHCQRDPLDTCISCYFQNFTNGNEHTFDLEALGKYYLQYQRLMKHWDAILPGRIITVQYEQLVEDTVSESKRLIGELGLEWDPACLEFYKTRRKVQTLSTWQVRQPVYNHSINRAAHYQNQFALLENILNQDKGK